MEMVFVGFNCGGIRPFSVYTALGKALGYFFVLVGSVN